jgi:hypothetical protein
VLNESVNSKSVLHVGCSLRSPFGFGIGDKLRRLISSRVSRSSITFFQFGGGGATQNAARLVIGRFLFRPEQNEKTGVVSPGLLRTANLSERRSDSCQLGKSYYTQRSDTRFLTALEHLENQGKAH